MMTLFTIAGREARMLALPNRPRFMLAADLAEIYGSTPKALTQAVKRHPDRFPEDFCFRLTEAEAEALRSQSVTANPLSAKARYEPVAFTHIGAYALSGVLRSPTAAAVSVEVHRAFAAMEARAMADAKFMLAKLRNETLVKKPIYSHVRLALEQGLSLEALWRNTSYPKHRIEQAVREMLAMRIIEKPLTGMQSDLFSAEG